MKAMARLSVPYPTLFCPVSPALARRTVMSISQPAPTFADDERRPLLAGTEPLNATAATGADLDAEDPVLKDVTEVEEKRSWWTIFWYALFTIVGAVILGVFIKGFIDADDVEVCILI